MRGGELGELGKLGQDRSSSLSLLGLVPEAEEEEEAPQEAEQPSTSGSQSEEHPFSDLLLRHKITKFDTLAGLAVRYHVTVGDIKRANGFLSDMQMFAQDTLLIPKKPLPPPGPEYSTWAGMIVTHYGRLGTADNLPYALSPTAASIQQLRGYFSTGHSPTRPHTSSDDDGGHLFANGQPDWRSAGEVELMTRGGGGGGGGVGASSAYAEERLRRRRAGEGSDDGEGPSSSFSFLPALQQLQRPALFGASSSGGAAQPSLAQGLSQLGAKTQQWKSTLVDRLKKAAANHPALAAGFAPSSGGGSSSLGSGGEAAFASAGASGGAPAAGGSGSSGTPMQQLSWSSIGGRSAKASSKAD